MAMTYPTQKQVEQVKARSGCTTCRLGFSHRISPMIHCYIPTDDTEWIVRQNTATMNLFMECWSSDPYGLKWVELNTKLREVGLARAMAKLSDQGLFAFKQMEGRWLVKNLHGSDVVEFWGVQMDNPPRNAHNARGFKKPPLQK